MSVERSLFGTSRGGQRVDRFSLRNRRGTHAVVSEYGATLNELWIADANGELADIVLGFAELSSYESEDNPYMGCVVGRVANRIARARFELDGRTFELSANHGPHHIHGGESGFGKLVWTGEQISDEACAVRFHLISPDGDQGYPGCLRVEVTYSLSESDELRMDARAHCDAATIVNLANHSYFNLSGAGTPSVLDHELKLDATHFTPADEELIPDGSLEPVAETPLDFRVATALGTRIAELETGPTRGFDHGLMIDGEPGQLRRAARLRDPTSGRQMEVWTTQPSLQLYSGNLLRGQRGKNGRRYPARCAVCLETQHPTDAVHHPGFPSIILRPGEIYAETTTYRFGTPKSDSTSAQ
ncbi:MAG: galactose mutarotase [bacterium]|nr:galactose mutarotase [bacterium]